MTTSIESIFFREYRPGVESLFPSFGAPNSYVYGDGFNGGSTWLHGLYPCHGKQLFKPNGNERRHSKWRRSLRALRRANIG